MGATSNSSNRVVATVLLCTYNRATLLATALDSLRHVKSADFPWELLVVDNNSSDNTRGVVERAARRFPVPLRYVFEAKQGKCHALNRGVAGLQSPIVLFGDDDQTFDELWVEEACRTLIADPALSYAGGPVLPLWSVDPPAWFRADVTELKAPLGLFDYGPDRFVFETRRLVAGGGNLAVRRELLQKVGAFRTELGRRGRSLIGQEQAEFFHRTRAANARGLYVPTMRVFHHVPPERLKRSYCRRWWFWKGVAQSRVHRMHQRTELGLDLSRVPHLLSIPRFIIGSAVQEAARWLVAAVTPGKHPFVHELRLAYALGYASERRRRPESGPWPMPESVSTRDQVLMERGTV
jgi:glycosyltransferase involved in cell wall biosynthesis